VATVELEGVEKAYPGGTRAVCGIDLCVADGELLVLVGPSGCGKSTVLRLIAGLEAISRGTLRIGGRVANDLSPQERNVAMVFQDYALYPHLTVRGNIEFPLRMRRMPRAERQQRVEETAGLLGIEGLLERLPQAISGGQRQRVAMGRALVRQPAVFLLDEPLSNLDAKLRTQVRAEIGQLQRRTGTTMIYVTHDQAEAMTLGDRVAVLQQGSIQQIGNPRDLYAAPTNVFVAGFIGTPPMNLLAAKLEAANDGLLVRVGGHSVRHIVAGASVDRLLPQVGAALTLGVRPEGWILLDATAADALDARAVQTEFLGHENLIYLESAGVAGCEPLRFVCRREGGASVDAGATVHARIAVGAARLFDAAGLALLDL